MRRLAAALVLALTAACSGSPDGPSCPTLATSCPAVVPSWSNEVQPIVRRSCYPCHEAGGTAVLEGHDFETYAGFTMSPSTVESDVIGCNMPEPGGNEPLSATDAQTIVSWFACGHPEN